jgi:hypothetical protein
MCPAGCVPVRWTPSPQVCACPCESSNSFARRRRTWTSDDSSGSTSRTLVERVRRIAGDKYVCMEEAAQSEWLYELLEPHAKEIVVTQPLRRAGCKNDGIDAWEPADLRRSDALEATVFKSPKTCTAFGQEARGYIAMRGDMVRSKVQLHALFRSRGIQPNADIYDPDARESWLKKLPPSSAARRAAGQTTRRSVAVAPHSRCRCSSKPSRLPITHRLATVPGIGFSRKSNWSHFPIGWT